MVRGSWRWAPAPPGLEPEAAVIVAAVAVVPWLVAVLAALAAAAVVPLPASGEVLAAAAVAGL